MALPLVSYVIPSFNHARYIGGLLASLCAQTLNEIEIIVVDDGSSDGTRASVEQIAKLDKRIQFHTFENQGITANRNRGLALAKGKYISFVDSDDMIPQDRTNVMVACLEQHHEAVLCYGDADLINEENVVIGRFSAVYPTPEFEGSLGRTLWLTHCFVPSVSVMITREALISSGGFWGPGSHTDYLKWIELCVDRPGIRLSGKSLGSWRFHGRNTSVPGGDRWRKHYSDLRNGLEELLVRCPDLKASISDKQRLQRLSRCHLMAAVYLQASSEWQGAAEEFEQASLLYNSLILRSANFMNRNSMKSVLTLCARAAVRYQLGPIAKFMLGDYRP